MKIMGADVMWAWSLKKLVECYLKLFHLKKME